MTPSEFFSPDAETRIEPGDFVGHFLAQRGLNLASVGLRPTVVLPLIPVLERRLLRALGDPSAQPPPIQRQALYQPADVPFALITSPMGAPMAVMLLEQLIALGARRVLYLGFCGALIPPYRIGDLLLPTYGVREEGTSYHYVPADVVPYASPQIQALLQAQALRQRCAISQGPIWTTDAPYRETPHKIRQFQDMGIHAVDMEMAALFAVAQYRGCELGALLIVSDECYHPTWKPGFGAPRLRQACDDAVSLAIATARVLGACSALSTPPAAATPSAPPFGKRDDAGSADV
jgi:purine-nucleoside phosphorylase